LLRRPGRRGLILGATAALIAAAGVGVAVFLSVRTTSGGGLDAPTAVTVVTTDTTPVKRPTKPPHLLTAEKPCWPAFGGGPLRSLSRSDIKLGVPGHSVWARGMGDLMEYPPTYCHGRLFVNLEQGRTVALDASTGKVLWSRRAPGPTASSPAIAGPNVVVSSHGGTVTALRQRDGALVWQLQTNVPVESSPVASDGTVYVGASDGRLFALGADTGATRWIYDFRGRISSSPSVVGALVCITTYTGAVACLHRVDGTRAWIHYFKRDAFRYESFYSSPSSDGQRVFAVARTGTLIAIEALTGDTLWTYRTGALTYGTPSVANGRVFVADLTGGVVALHIPDGARLWRTHVPGRVLGPTLVVGNLVFFSTLESQTYAALVTDGHIVWHFRAGKYAPGIATEKHYYLSLNGLLAAFAGTRTTSP
jgi:outer membrane protein assembly factor BamB